MENNLQDSYVRAILTNNSQTEKTMNTDQKKLHDLITRGDLPKVIISSPVWPDTRIWPPQDRDGGWWASNRPAMLLSEHFTSAEMDGLLEKAISIAKVRVTTCSDDGGHDTKSARHLYQEGVVGKVIGTPLLRDLQKINTISRVGEESHSFLIEGAIAHLVLILMCEANVDVDLEK